MILMSHPTGNQNVRNAAVALAQAGQLKEFWTCLRWNEHSRATGFLPPAIRSELHRRSFPRELTALIRTSPWREIGRHVAERLNIKTLTRKETGFFSIDAIYWAFDRHVAARVRNAKDAFTSVYCYEDGALETFRAANEGGLDRLYELPIGYWRAAQIIFREEVVREPEWASTLHGISDSPAKLERKDEELRLASSIIVPSNFTKNTLSLAPGLNQPIHVIPYGAPLVATSKIRASRSGALKVLFVGGLGQRKGLSYLLKAVAMVKHNIELTLIGRKACNTCRPLQEATEKHRWIPSLPHAGVLDEMAQHDILVFPTLFEGFGLVILEAMSQGLPVITTPNSGGSDLIQHGIDGFIVPIRSAAAIAEQLALVAGNRQLLEAMQHAARATANRHSWEHYRQQLVEMVAAQLRTW